MSINPQTVERASLLNLILASHFMTGYVVALQFTEEETIELQEGEYLSVSKMSTELLREVVNDYTAFVSRINEALPGYFTSLSADERALMGHDFWLTRNGHGAGFWDGDWPEHGDKLTEIAEEFGEVWVYVGDDGKVYLSH